MINTKLFNIHDVILIGSIAIIFHVLSKPLFARIGLTGGKSDS